jgi:bisphosphoglycerate-independent phosphoglycerate mutase (AlkP superfamily)
MIRQRTETLGSIRKAGKKSKSRLPRNREKYPHVTFFFSGGRRFRLKELKLLKIHKVATYDSQPRNEHLQIKDALVLNFI